MTTPNKRSLIPEKKSLAPRKLMWEKTATLAILTKADLRGVNENVTDYSVPQSGVRFWSQRLQGFRPNIFDAGFLFRPELRSGVLSFPMKRFTATEKWRNNPWFRKLPSKLKLFWIYLCDNCDAAGVWEVDLEEAGFYIGEDYTEEEILKSFGHRIYVFADGSKWWLTGFIEFQYGELVETCAPHKAIIARLKRHGLERVRLPLGKGIYTLKEKEKDKDTEEEKEGKGSGENQPATPDPNHYEQRQFVDSPTGEQLAKGYVLGRKVLAKLNLLTKSSFRETADNLDPIAKRLIENEYDVNGMITMVDRQAKLWRDDPKLSQGLTPRTLFGDRFSGYYGQRDKPIPSGNGKPRSVPDHSKGF